MSNYLAPLCLIPKLLTDPYPMYSHMYVYIYMHTYTYTYTYT